MNSKKPPFFGLTTGCGSHFRNPRPFKILKKPFLVLKQTLHQQKALYLSFNLTPWKWAWHYQEGATPPRREKHILLIFYGRVEVFWLFGFNDISTSYNLNSKSCLKTYIIQFNFSPKLLEYLILANAKMLLRLLEFTAKLLVIYALVLLQVPKCFVWVQIFWASPKM